ncbi:MAG: NADH-quinone oxidoreductase subunit G [Nitriliruptoraceae bacterium]
MSESETSVDTVTLTIDGREVTVPKGMLIIRAAEMIGTIVPRFCDHPLLDPVGACRQCIVEIEGAPKPMMACTTPAGPDMVVKTHLTSQLARKGQEGTLEFLLVNHPLDCPMCDKGGECPLQDQALAHGSNASRFVDQKRRYTKPVAISSQILLDRERCVLCARCTRFADQIAGDPFIELLERSALEQVAIYEDEPFNSYFSGNIIQICPVGALTSTSYRFKARPFDVVTAPSVCDHCSAGCTLTVQSRRGEIQRQLARTNMAVNEAWNCDKGRFGFAHVTAPTRLTEPMVREDGQLRPASWSEALTVASRALSRARTEANGTSRVAVLTGGRLADEDAYVVSKYARSVLGTDNVDHRTRFAPGSELDEVLAAVGGTATAGYGDIEQADVIVVAGSDTEEEVPIVHLRVRKAWRNGKARIVVVGPHLGTLASMAWRHVAADPGGEGAVLAGLARGEGPDDVVEALRDAKAPAILIGERAGAGSLAAGSAIVDEYGGAMAWLPRRAGARAAVEAGLLAGALPGGRRLEDAADRDAVIKVWGGSLPAARGHDLSAILEVAAAGEIDVLHLIGVDLMVDAASTALAEKALAKVPVVIAQDLAMTATVAAHADVVLPASARQERTGTATNFEGRAQRFDRAVDGPGLVRDDWDIVRQLAAMLGRDLRADDLDMIRAEMERVGRRSEPHAFPQDVDAEVVDPSTLNDDEFVVLARALLLDRGTMLTGADDLLATARGSLALIAPSDADAVGIADGAEIEVAANGATMRLTAQIVTDVVPGTVVVPANSTEVPAGALAEASGKMVATVKVAATGADGEAA